MINESENNINKTKIRIMLMKSSIKIYMSIGLVPSIILVLLGIISEGTDRAKFLVASAVMFSASLLVGLIGAIYLWIKTR